MSGVSSTAGLVRRHLRSSRGASALVMSLVAALAALAVLAPLALTAVSDAALRHRIDTLSPVGRDVSTFVSSAPPAGQSADPVAGEWGVWNEELTRLHATIPRPLRDALEPPQTAMRVGKPVGTRVSTTYVAIDPRYDERVTIVEGRLPTTTISTREWERLVAASFDDGTGYGAPGAELPPIEIVMSQESADEVQWAIGATRAVGANTGWTPPQPLTLVGTFAPRDPDDPYWDRRAGMLRPTVVFDEYYTPWTRTTGFAAPDVLPILFPGAGSPLTEVWFGLRVDAFSAADAPLVLAQLRALTGRAQPTGDIAADLPALSLRGGDTIAALSDAIAQQRALTQVLLMLAAGPGGAALAALVIGCRLIRERRRGAVTLLRSRGASGAQVRGLLAIEGTLAGVVPALVGAGIAAVGWTLATGAPVGAALVVAPVVIGILPAIVLALDPPRALPQRVDAPSVGPWRRVGELSVAGLAALATASMIARGVGDTSAPLDPLVVVAPLLCTATVCLIALRLSPLVLRAVLAARRSARGAVSFVGVARSLRDPVTGAAPVFALVVGVAIAVSSGIVLSSVDESARSAARAAVGADVLVTAPRLGADAADRIAAIPGVAAIAPVSRDASVALRFDGSRINTTAYFVDAARLVDVQEGYPSFGLVAAQGSGPVPLVLSRALARDLVSGDEVELSGATAVVSGVSDATAAFSPSMSWVLVDAAAADEAAEDEPSPVAVLVRLADGIDQVEAARGMRAELDEGVRIMTPADQREAIESDPTSTAMRVALLACLLVAAALSALVVAMTLVLGAAARARILTLLTVLGERPRAAWRLVAWELVPVAAIAAVAGAALGALLPLLILATVDLAALTGADARPTYVADPVLLAVALGGFAVSTVLFGLLAAVLARRARVTSVLRTVEDT